MFDYEEDDQSQDQDQPPLPPGATRVPNLPPIERVPNTPPYGPGDTYKDLPPGAKVVPAAPNLPMGAGQFGLPQGARQYSKEEMDKAFRDAASEGRETFIDYLPTIGATTAVLASGQLELLPAMGYAAMGAGAGSVAKQGIQQYESEEPFKKEDIPEALYTTGKDMGVGAAGELGGRIVAAPFEALGGWAQRKWFDPERFYQSSLRPSTTLGQQGVKRVVRTGLREGIPVGQEGLEIAQGRVDDLNKQIANIIQKDSARLGRVIDPREIAQIADEIRPLFEQQFNPKADLNAISKSLDEFLEVWQNHAPYSKIEPHPSWGRDPEVTTPFYKAGEGKTSTPKWLTADEAQKYKQGTYISLRKKYGELGNADVETQKGLARGAKEQLEILFPALKNLNARDSALIELEHQLGNQVARAGNLNIAPLGSMAAVGMGLSSGHAPAGIFAGILKKVIDDPTLKSKLAIAIYRGSQVGLRGGRALTGSAVRAMATTHDLRQGKKTVLDSDPNYQFAEGGKVRYDDGGDVQDDGSEDEVLRDIYRRGLRPPAIAPDPAAEAALNRGPNIPLMKPGPETDGQIQLGDRPGKFRLPTQPLQLDLERAKQQLFGDYQAPEKPTPVPAGYEQPVGSEETGMPAPAPTKQLPLPLEMQLEQSQTPGAENDLPDQLIDTMTQGAGTFMQGIEGLSSTPDATVAGLMQMVNNPAYGASLLATQDPELRKVAHHVHQVIGGGMKLGTPLMLGMAGSPAAAARAGLELGGIMIAQDAAETGLRKMGVPDEYATVMGDLIGFTFPGVVKGGIEALPSKAAMDNAAAAARARLIANRAFEPGMTFGTGAGGMGQNWHDMAVLTGASLGSGFQAVGEQVAARTRQIKELMKQGRDQALSNQLKEEFQKVRDANPEINEVGDYMTAQEVEKMLASPKQVEAMSRLLRVLPSAEKMAAMAQAGVDKVGWYRGSSQALIDVFGADAPRFAQLLAATSPRISVEGNLLNALNIWKNWNLAGKPTDRQSIISIMAKSVQGKGDEKSAMEAWRNNTVEALTSKDPMNLTLSGPKVNSFQHNLRDFVFHVTNDAWMANAFGVAQDLFQGQGANTAARNPGMTTEYGGTSARIRAGAAQAGMFPSQGQETIWSVAMQLYEIARREGIDPREVLQKGYLKPEVIRATPDFSTLLRKPEYFKILREAGYGDAVEAMKPYVFAQAERVGMTPQQQQLLHEAAGTISDVMGMRDREGRSQQFAVPKGWTGNIPKATSKSAKALEERQRKIAGLYPPTATGVTNIEIIPGAGTGHAAAVANLPMGGRKAITSKMYGPQRDVQGRDIIQTAGLGAENTMPSRRVQGAYENSKGDIETQPGLGLPYEVKLNWTPDPSAPQPPVPGMVPMSPNIDPQVRKDIRGVLATEIFANAQEAAGSAILVPRPIPSTQPTRKTPWVEPEKTMTDFVVPLKKEVSARRLGAIAKQYPKFGYASAGPNMRVLGLGNPILERDAQWIMRRLKGKEYIPAKDIGEYLTTAKEWADTPGQRKVVGALFNEWDQMSPKRFAKVDQDLRQVIGDLLKQYDEAKIYKRTRLRPDLMNAYRIVAKGGLSALKTAYQNKAVLPAIVAAIALPPLLQSGAGETEEEPAGAMR